MMQAKGNNSNYTPILSPRERLVEALIVSDWVVDRHGNYLKVVVRQVIKDMAATGGNLEDVVNITVGLGIFDKGQEAVPQEKKPVKKLVVAEINEGGGSGQLLNLAEQGKHVILSTEDARRMYKRVWFKDDARILADAIDTSTRHA